MTGASRKGSLMFEVVGQSAVLHREVPGNCCQVSANVTLVGPSHRENHRDAALGSRSTVATKQKYTKQKNFTGELTGQR